jgi:hypothetical protein
MITMAQNPDDVVARMSAAAQMAPPPTQMAPVDPHAALTAPIGPPAPEPPPMMAASGKPASASSKMSASGETPGAPKMSKIDNQEQQLNSRLDADYAKDNDPWGSPDNHPGKLGSFLHGLAAAVPGVMKEVHGTTANRQLVEEPNLEGRLQSIGKQESAEGLQGAETTGKNLENANEPQRAADTHGQSSATTRHLNDESDALENAPAPVQSLASGHAYAVDQAIKRGADPATDPIVRHYENAIRSTVPGFNKPEAAPKTIQIEQGGKPHQMAWDEKTGKYDLDQGESGEKPPQIHVDTGAHPFQETERGRGLLDKAEQQFRTAQQGANTMRDMVASADAGNKMSAQMLPLEGALAITTAQGVHRINRTEVDQFSGGGSLYDKIAGEIGKVSEGQPIPPNIRNDIRKLTDLQEKGAYSTYKGAYDSATKRYGLKDEQALPEPGGGGGAPIVQHSPSTGQYRYSADGGKTWQAGQPKQ